MFGLRTRARPIATLCISPPDNSVALFFSLLEILSILDIFSIFVFISSSGNFLIGDLRGKAKFS